MAERARILFHLGRYSLAREELARVLADDPGSAYAHALLALCHAREGAMGEAQRAADEAVRCDPDSPFSHYARADVLRARGAVRQAADAALESIRVQPDYVFGWLILGQIRLDQRDYREAARCARDGLAAEPEETGCLLVLAASLVEMGYDGEAGGVMESLLRIAPEDPHAHALEGWRLLYRREHAAARARFQEALRLDPNMANAQVGLRRAWMQDTPFHRFYGRLHDPLMRRVARLRPALRGLAHVAIGIGEMFLLVTVAFVTLFVVIVGFVVATS